ncbi:Receptor-type tyrosine-protein phosphatase gamma [Collichthys lucidus]|uniref:Receptor-type tyrosine-protein phosphatase gamma n=1 Tax=Collichthys lucidus TaxID=240159 RepID=A0A4U5TV61_COLLU|nr:Receptor-type tyrosine-protein phosphatase gamma [Collichthys lucidus]
MAPISSGSSTWTSSGIPFSFVSMATGIGPSSSGSQATVASVVTSTLLAGLGFSGGVISSFPSSVWPSRTPTHNPTRQTTEPTKPAKEATTSSSAVMTAAAKDNSEAGGDDGGENSKDQGEDGERERGDKDEEEEEEKEKDEKKRRKGSGGAVERTGRKDNSAAVNVPTSDKPDAAAKEKKQPEPDPANTPPGAEDQLEYTHNPPDSNPATTTEATNETAAFLAPRDPAATLRPRTGADKTHWPFSIHTDRPSAATNMTHQGRPGSGAGLGRVEWLVPLVVVSALTFLCLFLLLAVLVYWSSFHWGSCVPLRQPAVCLSLSEHGLNDNDVRILDREDRWFERGVNEAIYVKVEKPSVNRGGGLRHHLSPTYSAANAVITKLALYTAQLYGFMDESHSECEFVLRVMVSEDANQIFCRAELNKTIKTHKEHYLKPPGAPLAPIADEVPAVASGASCSGTQHVIEPAVHLWTMGNHRTRIVTHNTLLQGRYNTFSCQQQHVAARLLPLLCWFTRMNALCSLLCVKYRRCFQTAHFYVEDSASPRVVPNETIPVIPIPGLRIFLGVPPLSSDPSGPLRIT